MRRNRKILVLAGMFGLIFGTSTGVTNAYLTGQLTALNNVITPGTVHIQLQETDWNPENARDLLAGSVIPKNPAVKNTGSRDAWVFLRVRVPVRTISVLDEATKRKTERTATEIFFWEANAEWQYLGKNLSEAESGYAEYVYGYQKYVKPGETTKTLFDDISLVNMIEGELDPEETFLVPVEAVAIQTDLESEGQGLEQIYQEYLTQKSLDERSKSL